MITIDEWRKQFTEFSESFLASYTKKMFKAKIRLYSFGPYLISVDEGQEIFSIDLSSLYNLHPILSTKQSPKNMTLLIDGRTFYHTSSNDLLVEFVDSKGDAFVFFSQGSPSEVIVCNLAKDYSKNKMSTFSLLRTQHTMFNGEKMKETAASSKFLIKTIKPRT